VVAVQQVCRHDFSLRARLRPSSRMRTEAATPAAMPQSARVMPSVPKVGCARGQGTAAG
jgi:hypothetical protein